MAAMWRKWKRIPWEWRWTIIVVSVIAGFYLFENTRGTIAWERFQDEIRKNGGVIYPEEFVIEPVPDEENFAMHPEIVRWNDREFRIEFPPESGFETALWQPELQTGAWQPNWQTGNRVNTAPYFPQKNYSEPEACEIFLSLTKEIEPHNNFLREAAAQRTRNLWILKDTADGPHPDYPDLLAFSNINLNPSHRDDQPGKK